MTRTASGLLCLTLLGGCHPPVEHHENILVIISDDIGTDKTGAWGPSGDTFTPTLDALASEGMRFTNAYASPTCSPARASLMTGRYSTRTGIGRWIFPNTELTDLSLDEVTIPEMLRHADLDFATAAVGKWHMVTFTRDDPPSHPIRQGFDHHRGSLANPLDAVQQGHIPRSYFDWEKNVDGEVEWSATYMTTDTVDEAIGMMQDLPEPWFLWVALNAAHDPWHVPPAELNPMAVDESSTEYELYDADTLAFDLELGRLLDAIDPQTRDDLTLIYVADNGTPGDVIEAPYDPTRGKATVFEGGVKVPMFVVGPHVAEPGSTSEALVHFVDLFPTVADLAGVDVDSLTVESGDALGEPLGLDGHSLLPMLADPTHLGPRDYLFTEAFFPNGVGPYYFRDRTVRSFTHKLVHHEDGQGNLTERFYDLAGGEYDEGPDLSGTTLTTAEQAELDALRVEMDRVTEDLVLGW